jgi:glutathione S-transferase
MEAKPMKIYGFNNTSQSRRVGIFLIEKGEDIPFQQIDMAGGEHRREPYLSKNPFGRIPVLEFEDGFCLSESIAICRYLESIFPEPALFGVTPRERTMIDMWQRRMELEVFVPIVMHARHSFSENRAIQTTQIPEWGEACRQRATFALGVADRRLGDNEFLAGTRFSIADIELAFSLLGMPGRTGIKVTDEWPNLKRWFDAIVRRPSIRNTQPIGSAYETGLIQEVNWTDR